MRSLTVWIISLCLAGQAAAEVIVAHNPVADIATGWADGTVGGSASGYNNGSVMNPGRHWSSVDDFSIADASGQPWQIDRVGFVCGTDLNAAVDTYRVSIYADSDDISGYLDVKWVYQGGESKLVNMSVIRTFAGGAKDRWLYEISVDTSSLGLLLSSNTTHYVSIEGDCANTDDIYNGYDTYYQRFYMLSAVDGGTSTQINDSHWYSGEYESAWSAWQQQSGDLVWTMEGHQVPEPFTLCVLLFGGAFLYKRRHGGQTA